MNTETKTIKATHTPGPWEIRPNNAGVTYIYERNSTKVLATVESLNDGIDNEAREFEKEANAALIAAAPALKSLLACALYRLSDGMDGENLGNLDHAELCAEISKHLSKAEGR